MTTHDRTWKTSIDHPSDDDLLCLIDGELAGDSAEHVRAHLEACWPCRTRAEKFQSTISSFIDYRSRVLLSMTEVPRNWSGFDRRLHAAVTETTAPSRIK